MVTSLTVTECWENLFLSIISPVLPLEVGGEYLMRFPLTSIGVILKGFLEDFVEGIGNEFVGSGELADDDEIWEVAGDESDVSRKRLEMSSL